jgi:hypothetical protein
MIVNYGTTFSGADITADGIVNGADFSTLLSHMGESITPPATPTIGPATLPDGTVGTAYNQTVTTAGGSNGPYSLRVTQGALPLGLTFSGASLAGMPTTVGSYAFTVSAFDKNNTYVAFHDYTLSIGASSGGSIGNDCATGTAYFCETFDSGGWNSTIVVPETSNGTTVVDVQNDVTGLSSKLLRLYTPIGGTGPNSSSTMAALYVNPGNYVHGTEGQDDWYRTDIYLPSDYKPSTGNWNWFTEWHVSNGVPQNVSGWGVCNGGVSNGLGIVTDYGPNYGANPRFWFRASGGDYTNCTQRSTEDDGASLPIVLGHKYQMLFHIKWSQKSDGSGLIEWYVDGNLQWQYIGPNLFLTTSGVPDNVSYGVYNYHVIPSGSVGTQGDWAITDFFDNFSAGPTRASVGG